MALQAPKSAATFFAAECEHFSGALRRGATVSQEQREAWRRETVFERRERVSVEVYDLCGGTVRHGPFAGLRLGPDVWWSRPDHGAMMLGLYEQEVLATLVSEAGMGRDRFICLGGADGYYAIGMLHAGFAAKATCFEMSDVGQSAIRANAQLNGVADRLVLEGKADEDFLDRVDEGDMSRALVLIDVEGAEFDILTPRVLKAMANAVVIIEIHNWIPDFLEKYERLLRNAEPWFELHKIQPTPRDLTRFEELRDFTDDNRLLLCSEGRPNVMTFLMLKPR